MAVNKKHDYLIHDLNYKNIVNYIDSLAKDALVKELEVFHKNNEHQIIIETLEKLPKEKFDVLLSSMLARAYNNVQKYQKAFDILKSLENKCKDLPLWNYRIAYSCYYLDRDDLALSYFNNYLESTEEHESEKEEIKEYIDIINQNMNYPFFAEPFKFRVEKVWNHFLNEEKTLLNLLSAISDKEESEIVLSKFKEILSPLFVEPSFGLNFNKGKWELTLSSDLDDSIFPAYIYFKSKMPLALNKYWKLFIGRQESKKEYSIDVDGYSLSPKDVHVLVRKLKKNSFKIYLYHKCLEYSTAEEYKSSYEIAYILTEQVLGEVRYIKFIEETDISNTDFNTYITLDQLPDLIKSSITLDISIKESPFSYELIKDKKVISKSLKTEEDKDIVINFSSGMTDLDWEKHSLPENLFKSTIDYQLPEKYTAVQGKIQSFRSFGKTTIPRIINSFIQGIGDEIAQEYHSCGAFIGMFIIKFNYSSIEDDIQHLAIINSKLHEKLNNDHFVYGSAFGFGHSFIDFIAWDLEAVMTAFTEIISEDNNIIFAGVKSIRTVSDMVRFK